MCYFCERTFKDSAAIQAHIVLMNHLPPFDSNQQQCRACKCTVTVRDVEQHKCAVLKTVFLRFVSGVSTIVHGPPYRCLFCRSQSVGSRVDLAMHLLCYHRPHKPPGRCGMCIFTYEEPTPSPSPNVPPLPANATEEQKKEHAKAVRLAVENQMCELPVNPTPGLDSLSFHTSTEHTPAYTLWSRRNIMGDSNLRFPYACPICGWVSKTNYAFHAHVICCHGNLSEIQNDLKICAMCGFAAVSDSGLNQHVLMNHTELIKRYGNLWIKRELLMNVTDLATTCGYCWETFRFDFQLQAHLLAAHTTNNPLRCGWCKVDFLSCADPIVGFMIMQHHELNHARTLHEVALRNEYTYEQIKDPLPEVPDKEILIASRMKIGGVPTEAGDGKGKKGSPKKSPGKSPKSKSSKSGSKKSKK